MRVAALVPAAGRGERLGPGAPKALRELRGAPMLLHAVGALAGARLIDVVVVAAPPHHVAATPRLLASHEVHAEITVVPGGAERQDSVGLALAALPVGVDVVLVHDAARPLVPCELVDAVARAVLEGADAVVPGLPVADTVKRVELGRAAETVVETLDRPTLRAIQTPQGFRRSVLEAAHAAAAIDGGAPATDDAGLVERIGVPVVIVPGAPEAFKITSPLDLLMAEALLAHRRSGHAG